MWHLEYMYILAANIVWQTEKVWMVQILFIVVVAECGKLIHPLVSNAVNIINCNSATPFFHFF